MTTPRTLTRRQVRAVDRWAIDTLGLPGVVLMENAGRQVADAAEFMLMPGESIGVLAGAGNNGGDGLVAARHLHLRGWAVVVELLAPADKFAGDALINLQVARRLGLTILEVAGEPADTLGHRWGGYGLLIDALGGTGIEGALRGPLADAVEAANAAGPPILAVDIPTGLDCDTGTAAGPAIRAMQTVTFVARKAGFDNPAARACTGEVKVADIGVPSGP